MGKSVSTISVQVPSSLCTDTLSWSGEWLSSFLFHFLFPLFIIFHLFSCCFFASLLSSSFLFLFFLAFFPCFLSLYSSLHSSFPSLEVSLLSLELAALYWLSKHCFMPGIQLITMKHQSKGSIFPGKCFQQFLFLACCVCLQYCKLFCTGNSFRLQDHTWFCVACWSSSR